MHSHFSPLLSCFCSLTTQLSVKASRSKRLLDYSWHTWDTDRNLTLALPASLTCRTMAIWTQSQPVGHGWHVSHNQCVILYTHTHTHTHLTLVLLTHFTENPLPVTVFVFPWQCKKMQCYSMATTGLVEHNFEISRYAHTCGFVCVSLEHLK